MKDLTKLASEQAAADACRRFKVAFLPGMAGAAQTVGHGLGNAVRAGGAALRPITGVTEGVMGRIQSAGQAGMHALKATPGIGQAGKTLGGAAGLAGAGMALGRATAGGAPQGQGGQPPAAPRQ